MSWFYERFVVPSEINGPISCTRLLGQWNVTAGGVGQADDYLNGLWKDAFPKLPRDLSVRRILMLGFGPGETLKMYAKRFPKASLTVVEIDPVMVDLARRFGHLNGKLIPEIIIGDAAEVLPRLQGQYDLIVLDMFIGINVGVATYQETVIQNVLRLLRPHGAILMNAYLEPEAIQLWKKHCTIEKRWKYRLNHVTLFRPWGSGIVGDPLPSIYQHSMTCKEYIQREYGSRPGYEVTHSGEVYGIRKRLPGFAFDHYIGDSDPAKEGRPKGARLALWQPITIRPDRSTGWRPCPVPAGHRLTGFAQIPIEGPFHVNWSEHAKRHRARWLKQTEYEVVDADPETYIKIFYTCGKRKSLIDIFSEEVRRKAVAHGERMTLRVARHRETHEIIAGFASLWIPEIQQTFHVTSFLTPAGQKTSAAVGLVDDCFQIAQARGCRTLEFDGFRTQGDPASWSGFTQFKSQFDVFYVRWPGLWLRWD